MFYWLYRPGLFTYSGIFRDAPDRDCIVHLLVYAVCGFLSLKVSMVKAVPPWQSACSGSLARPPL